MANSKKRCAVLLLALSMMLSFGASAEGQLAFDGTVAADEQVSVTAPIGGCAADLKLIAGQRVEAGEQIMTLNAHSPSAPLFVSEPMQS